MNDKMQQIRELLHEAAETHHIVYKIVDGDDPDWASWYSEWLLTLSDLPIILGIKPVRSELTYLLVTLDKEYTKEKPAEKSFHRLIANRAISLGIKRLIHNSAFHFIFIPNLIFQIIKFSE